jgi:hypothetical protein
MPDHLVCQDVDAQLELITNKHTRKNKCYFRGFGLIPSMNYDMLRQTVKPQMKVGENSPKTENFVNFSHHGISYFIWVDSSDLIEDVEWWDDDWNTDAVALRLACQHNIGETFYCVGFDYYHEQTSSGIYLGSNVHQFHEKDNTVFLKNHKTIEGEHPDCKFVFVGKDIEYSEFEKMFE